MNKFDHSHPDPEVAETRRITSVAITTSNSFGISVSTFQEHRTDLRDAVLAAATRVTGRAHHDHADDSMCVVLLDFPKNPDELAELAVEIWAAGFASADID